MTTLTTNDRWLEVLLTTEIALFTKTATGRYDYINAPGARMLGREPGEIVGRSDDGLFAPGTVEVIRLRDAYVRGLRDPFVYECRSQILGDARPTSFFSVKSSIRNGVGEATGLLALSLVSAPGGVPARTRELIDGLAHDDVRSLIEICRRGRAPRAL